MKEGAPSEAATPKSTRKSSSSTTTGLRSCVAAQVEKATKEVDGFELHTDLKCIRCCLKLRNAEYMQREHAKSPLAFLKSIG